MRRCRWSLRKAIVASFWRRVVGCCFGSSRSDRESADQSSSVELQRSGKRCGGVSRCIPAKSSMYSTAR
ncbi:hypothetical protein YC2023_042929 [Brassica napus]